jgi:hypothetical protein
MYIYIGIYTYIGKAVRDTNSVHAHKETSEADDDVGRYRYPSTIPVLYLKKVKK